MEEGRKAGAKLLQFFMTEPLGEEILEGTLGGLMVGASQLGSDQSLGQTALETAAAIAGGIGLGAAGRRIGAHLGKKFHAGPLKDQNGMLAMAGRLTGMETTGAGLKEQGKRMRAMVEQGLMNESAARMAQEAIADPRAFQVKYNLNPQEFEQLLAPVMAGRAVSGAVKTYADLPPEQRVELLKQLQPLIDRYGGVEQAIAQNAASGLNENIDQLAAALRKAGARDGIDDDARKVMGDLGDYVQGMNSPATPITGEHVGRAVGRFLGDEIGIMGGLALGSALAPQLGMESPKDRKIRELEQQLAGRS